MAVDDTPSATYTVAEAARVLGVSRAKAYQLARIHAIPVCRVGVRSTRVPRAALAAWIEANTQIEPAR